MDHLLFFRRLDSYEKMMRKEGVSISEFDVSPFKKATMSVYETVGLGDIKKRVRALMALP